MHLFPRTYLGVFSTGVEEINRREVGGFEEEGQCLMVRGNMVIDSRAPELQDTRCRTLFMSQRDVTGVMIVATLSEEFILPPFFFFFLRGALLKFFFR